MIGGLKPHAAYKDSGLTWLGKVPAHWQIVRSKRLFTARKELARPDDVQLSATQAYGVIAQSLYEERTGYRVVKISMHLDKRRHVERDDFIISMRSFQGGLERAWSTGAIRSSYVVLKPDAQVDAAYFRHLFKSVPYIAALRATGDFIRDGQDLNYTNFCGVDLPLIPLSEQAAIGRLLDWANANLERTIRAKRKTIALLTEQKQAIIHHAVTCSLESDTPLKPSGVPWIGDIPQHWSVMPIKRTCRLVRDGTHLPPARTVSGFPLLSVRNMIDGRLVRRTDDSFISQADFEQLNRSFVVRPNDVLMAIVGATLGKVAVVDDIGPFQIQRSVALLRPRTDRMAAAFLATFLRSPRLQQHLWQSVAFSAQPGIYLGFVANIPVPVPPTVEEQLSICDGLQRGLAPVEAAAARITKEIELLREYRARLVADIVTGKLDVREAALRLPDETTLRMGEDLVDEPDVVEFSDEETEA